MSSNVPAIGIDLGTTYSCVAVWQYGKVEVIANDHGSRTTPSYVAFTRWVEGESEAERLVGEAAKNQAAMNPANTVYDVKRLIGRRFDDPTVEADMRHWPYTVVNDSGFPKIEIEYEGENELFYPEQISSMVLEKMKETAEGYLGVTVRDAVITVPAYFTDSQRHSTMVAGTIAGLNVLSIINEPTAAALAYGLDKSFKERNILIFDLGGGTLDVSILKIKNNDFQVMATAGNTHLGGVDFDNLLLDYFVDEFKKRHKKDVLCNPRALTRLRTAVEQAKRTLSSTTEAFINIDALMDGIDYSTKLTRSRYEDRCKALFLSTLEPMKQALEDAKLNKEEIDDVVLVGGSSRIPKIQALLQDFFPGKKLNMNINPDEAVAYGAAIKAAMMKGDTSLQNFFLVDVTPLSLGIDAVVNGVKGTMVVVIPRNTIIPCTLSCPFWTVEDNQTVVKFPVYEGEGKMVKDNKLLASFNISGIPSAPRRALTIVVLFEINANGVLKVTASEETSKQSNSMIIFNKTSNLSSTQMSMMLDVAKNLREAEKKRKDDAKARNELEMFAMDLQETLYAGTHTLTPSQAQDHCKWIDDTLQRIRNERFADKTEYERQLKELKEKCPNLLP